MARRIRLSESVRGTGQSSDMEQAIAVSASVTRNCPDSHVVYVDDGPDGSNDVPAPC